MFIIHFHTPSWPQKLKRGNKTLLGPMFVVSCIFELPLPLQRISHNQHSIVDDYVKHYCNHWIKCAICSDIYVSYIIKAENVSQRCNLQEYLSFLIIIISIINMTTIASQNSYYDYLIVNYISSCLSCVDRLMNKQINKISDWMEEK